jgi:hypothetical protein
LYFTTLLLSTEILRHVVLLVDVALRLVRPMNDVRATKRCFNIARISDILVLNATNLFTWRFPALTLGTTTSHYLILLVVRCFCCVKFAGVA